MHTNDRIRGCLFGQAVGDALGLGTEFMTKAEAAENYPGGLADYAQIIRDYHRSKFRPGHWSDDTDMMLCVARALLQDKGINLHTIAQNFKTWLYAPQTRGIGRTTYKVLSFADYVEKPQQAAELVWRLSRGQNAANGAIMRTPVVGLLRRQVATAAADICRLTHFDPRCVGSCVVVSEVISHLIWQGEALSQAQVTAIANGYDSRIAPYITMAAETDIAALQLDEEASIGYTLKAMGAALWCLFHARSFEEGLLAVVNEAGDADTNAAVACAILGAKFGYSAIPAKYTDGLLQKEELSAVAEALIPIVSTL